MNAVKIVPIPRTPNVIPVVAGWIWNEFWSHGNGYTQDDLVRLLGQAAEDVIPMGWVAWRGSQPAGCVNLIENDDEQRRHLRPWLAALYVHPSYRRQGIGRSLVETVLEALVRLGEPTVFLGTDNPDFYRNLGASIHESQAGSPHRVMRFDLPRPARR